MFCKECIFSNLLQQREKLDEQKRLFEVQQAEMADAAASAEVASTEAELEAFRSMESAVVAPAGAAGAIFQLTKDVTRVAEAAGGGGKLVEEARLAQEKFVQY